MTRETNAQTGTMTSERMFQKALECERRASEMRRLGDFHAERALKRKAECWLDDAILVDGGDK